MPPHAKPIEERFWSKVRKGSGCWLWLGRRDGWGYGQFSITHGTSASAHRMAYELLIGPMPDGMQLDHLCRIQACVRPDHLEVVTPRENVMRGTGPSAANARKTQCKNGHPFNEENTLIQKDGHRNCRACRRQYIREWNQRQTDIRPFSVASSGYLFSQHPIREPR